jgi:hypothetical protein
MKNAVKKSLLVIMNTNKAEFVSNVQKWVSIDTQLKLANEKIRIMRENKHQLTTQICDYMGDRDAKIEISDGNLRIYARNEYKPLTFSYIEDSLRKIITNEEHVNSIMQHLRDNRDVTVSNDIRRNVTK